MIIVFFRLYERTSHLAGICNLVQFLFTFKTAHLQNNQGDAHVVSCLERHDIEV